MLDFLDKINVISEKDYFNLMSTEVEPYLAKKRKED